MNIPQDQPTSTTGDAREFVEKLRNAPAEDIVAEAFFMLLNAAQLKLGRRDARLLIDLCSAMLEHAKTSMPETLVKQVGQSLAQLRLGQVSAESAVARQQHAGPDDPGHSPTSPATGTGGEGPQSPASGLWVPGR